LNSEKGNFKISDYQFDDEDAWDEAAIDNVEKNRKIKKLIRLARGVYFDECHHAAAKTVTDVLTASEAAYWRFGGSATPYRESGDDIMIQAMFGSKIVDISASYLIRQGSLVTPYVFFVPIDTEVNYHSWKKVYKECIVNNERLNNHVADTANHIVSKGMSTLILVQQYAQGQYLEKLIPGSRFITGETKLAKRNESLEDLRQKKLQCMIATSLADEGLDIPTLDTAILAGGGKSSTRLHQRIGRTIRKDKEGAKDKSIVIVYDHFKTRFLKKHTKRVKSILKKEKEFKIIDSKGMDFLNREIDDIMGLSDSNSILEL